MVFIEEYSVTRKQPQLGHPASRQDRQAIFDGRTAYAFLNK